MKTTMVFLITTVLFSQTSHSKENSPRHISVVGEFNTKGELVAQPTIIATTGKKYGAEVSFADLRGSHKVSIELIPPISSSDHQLGSTRVSRVMSSAVIDFSGTPRTYSTGAYTLLEGQPRGIYEFRFYLDGKLIGQGTLGIHY